MKNNVFYNENLKKIFFRDNITEKSIFKLSNIIYNLDKDKNKYNNIDLHITSDGGDTISGLLGYDLIKSSKNQINTYCNGFVASSASILFLGGKQRFMTKNSFIMIHQLSINNFHGKLYEIDDMSKNTNLIMEHMKNIYLQETTITKEMLEHLLQKDLYLNSKFCLEHKFINKIV